MVKTIRPINVLSNKNGAYTLNLKYEYNKREDIIGAEIIRNHRKRNLRVWESL